MPEQRTFTVDVPGVGTFECRRRTMRVLAAISAEYNRLTEGAQEVSDEFASFCDFLSYLKVMIVSGPEGWDPYEADPDEPGAMEKFQTVYREVQSAEARFRQRSGGDDQGQGAGAEHVDRVVVSEPVQPAGDGPAVPGGEP